MVVGVGFSASSWEEAGGDTREEAAAGWSKLSVRCSRNGGKTSITNEGVGFGSVEGGGGSEITWTSSSEDSWRRWVPWWIGFET